MATPAAAAVPAPTDAPEAPAKKKRGKLVPMILGVVLLAGAGGGAWWFMNRSSSHEAAAAGEEGKPAEGAAAKTDTIFVPLESAFIVNLEDEDAMRFMQIEAQVVVRDAKSVDLVKNNMPIVRNRLMLLFSGQHYRDLNTRAAKEKLQADALAEVQKALTEATGKPQVEALYITSMVIQ
ncbi:MAG TPA: flagellar basal body-associated FliL family protein [Nevskiaceae bacterium]|nr:flagellar basal body-associated FliL family protein [Nevskiaceae bacterium]